MSKHWIPVRDGDPRVRGLYNRHYSCYKYKDGRRPAKTVGPGEYICLLTLDCTALFIWRKFRDNSGQKGVNCSVFRNEGTILSSLLIREAVDWAWQRWPSERLYTYINGSKIRSNNPGYCFKRAGWRPCGITGKGLLILEFLPFRVVSYRVINTSLEVSRTLHFCDTDTVTW